MVLNQYLNDLFFSFDIKFPKDGQVQSSLSPLLVFHQSFSLNTLGEKQLINQVVSATDIQAAITAVQSEAVTHDHTLEEKFDTQIKAIDLTL